MAPNRRDRLRAMLADLKIPGALDVVDGILSEADSGAISPAEAIEQLLNAQIVLHNNRRLQTAMRSSGLGRKNYLFMGSASGGRAAAIAYTLSAAPPGCLRAEGLADELHRLGDLPLVIQLHLDIAIDEVAPGELVRGAALASGADLGLEVIDQVDDVVEAAARALADVLRGIRPQVWINRTVSAAVQFVGPAGHGQAGRPDRPMLEPGQD